MIGGSWPSPAFPSDPTLEGDCAPRGGFSLPEAPSPSASIVPVQEPKNILLSVSSTTDFFPQKIFYFSFSRRTSGSKRLDDIFDFLFKVFSRITVYIYICVCVIFK